MGRSSSKRCAMSSLWASRKNRTFTRMSPNTSPRETPSQGARQRAAQVRCVSFGGPRSFLFPGMHMSPTGLNGTRHLPSFTFAAIASSPISAYHSRVSLTRALAKTARFCDPGLKALNGLKSVFVRGPQKWRMRRRRREPKHVVP
ncbi:hypothetical protein GSI_09882 [Ganoderma sinense ZZ0214-1]|uniref:Uncharacterized protein n=1 Tax=Ganoderma sinense ZZ0214-1 TaxID=1077348 RepID=A0A2G8S2Q5_9APHY|nr:hypothetical protein GSI_09882 [Ganoderma sinense ZZ0214-1]